MKLDRQQLEAASSALVYTQISAMLELILFYIFGAITIASAICVIHPKERRGTAPCFLASTLLAVAGIFLTLHAEFLAGVQVIVGMWADPVLFVFVHHADFSGTSVTERQFNRQWMIALVAAAALIVEFAMAFTAAKIPLCFPRGRREGRCRHA